MIMKKAAWLALILALLIDAYSVTAITCSDVAGQLSPCIRFIGGGEVGDSGPCCNGVKGLNNAASTTAIRRYVCGCLKNLAGSLPRNYASAASGIAGKCGVSLPYQISTGVDCNSVP